jgi:hypothetical protein
MEILISRPFTSILRPLLILLLSLCTLPALLAQSREYPLQAAFLFNFAQFVEWPAQAFPATNSPIVIGILGEKNLFGSSLSDLTKGELVHGHPIEIRLFRSLEQIDTCHILFINPIPTDSLPPIIEQLRERPILTVSDMEDFAKKGGMIRFVTVQNKIRFRINVQAAKEAGLVLSSKLLRLSELVQEPPG